MSGRVIDAVGHSLVPEPGAGEAQAMGERSGRAGHSLVPEPRVSEVQV
ncbi:hypothetical protein [Nocardia amamiensis]|nr:hypothetical protein [Nocardia amamiensis]